ncbi:MAG: class I SAM-dependent methyltransferase [Pseudomonadota bacterium]
MNPRLQTRVQRYGWDKAEPYYEAGWKESLAPAQAQLLDMTAARPGERVLDLACGTGLVSFPLAKAVGSSGHVTATDLSDNMVESIVAQAACRRVSNIEAFRADAEKLDMIEDEGFDLVTCALGLMYCPDPVKAISEAFRVLRPGGRAVFAVWGARKACGWADIFPIVDARVESDVCPLFFRLGTGETLAKELAGCGFERIETRRVVTTLPYSNDRDAVDAAFVGGPVAMAYARFDEPTRRIAEAEYLTSIAPFKSKAGYKIPGEFVVCAGVRGRAA